MADSISAQITANIKTALETISGVTVEYGRQFFDIQNRYPYIALLGPNATVENQAYKVDDTTLEYLIQYIDKVNDDSQTPDTEYMYQKRNTAADIIAAVMADKSRGNLAQHTKTTSYSFEDYGDADMPLYGVAVVIEVQARIDSDDPYSIA